MRFPSPYIARLIIVGTLSCLWLTHWISAAPGDPVTSGWPVSTTNVVFSSPAIGPNGEIVVGSEDGKVYSFNPNGTTQWVFSGATDWIDSSPAINEDGTVYVGGWDGILYAINGQTGQEIWRFSTGDTGIGEGSVITASPLIGPDGTIYFGAYNGKLYALNPDGSEKWTRETDSALSIINEAAVLNESGDTLYYGTETGMLFALDVTNGSLPEKWLFTVPPIDDLPNKLGQRAISGAPVIGPNGYIYFCCENGVLYEIDPEGNLSSKFSTLDSMYSSPVINSSGQIFIVSFDGYLYALASDPNLGFILELWEVFIGDVVYSVPAIDHDGNIIVAGYTGTGTIHATTLYSISSSGNLNWSRLITNSLNDSSPNIAPDGSIYIGAHDGKIYKFEGSAELASDGWPRKNNNRRQSGWQDDLGDLDMVNLFPDIEYNFAGWANVPWFGIGLVASAGPPMIEHFDHGLIHIGQTSPDGVIFFDYKLNEWVYGPVAAPSYYFSFSSATWLYHLEGTNVWNGRWFYDIKDGEWLSGLYN